MRKSKNFRPEGVSPLEERVVLNAAVLTTHTLSQVTGAIQQDFASFTRDYNRAIRTVHLDANGNPNQADLNRFITGLNNRGNLLGQQLASLSFRIPFGGKNLGPLFKQEVAAMIGNLESVSTINQALHPSATIVAGKQSVLNDLRSFLVAGRQAGAIVIR